MTIWQIDDTARGDWPRDDLLTPAAVADLTADRLGALELRAHVHQARLDDIHREIGKLRGLVADLRAEVREMRGSLGQRCL